MATKQAAKQPRNPETRIPFSVRIGNAREVILTGDFTRWSEEGIRLSNGVEDTWSASLALPPGRYEYRLRVDGLWADDPGAAERVPNPFGTENAVLRVT